MAAADLGAQARAELAPGEQVLWQGAPRQGVILCAGDALLIPFSLIWCGFAVFWTVMAGGSGAPVVFPIFGLTFVCVGMYFVFGRFLAPNRSSGAARCSV